MDVSNVKVEFTMSGEVYFKPDEITKKIGITPTYVREKGEILRNGNIFPLSEWGIETEYIESLDINDQLSIITEQLKDKVVIINEICTLYNLKCTFVIVVNIEQEEKPAMYFDSEFIQFAASINADIGFDLYFYS